jgi:hypothetical protein
MEPEGSLPCSQEPSTGHCPIPNEPLPPCVFKIRFSIIPIYAFVYQVAPSLPVFPDKTLYALLIFPVHVTYPANLIPLYCLILTIDCILFIGDVFHYTAFCLLDANIILCFQFRSWCCDSSVGIVTYKLWGTLRLLLEDSRGRSSWGVKLTTRFYHVPKSRMSDLYLHSPIRLHSAVLNYYVQK